MIPQIQCPMTPATVAALAVLLCFPRPSSAQSLDQRFGVVMSTDIFKPATPRLLELGAGSVRGGCDWQEMEPSELDFEWGNCSDAWVSWAQSNGVRLLFNVGCTPGWANGNQGCNVMPSNWSDWDVFVQAFITHYSTGAYSSAPTTVVLGFWNEPNLNGISVDDYCNLFQTAAAARNDTDSGFVLGAPETSYHAVTDPNEHDYFASVMACIEMAPQDVVTVHYYTDTPIGVLSYIDAVDRSLADNYSGGRREIWLTEAGAGTQPGTDGYVDISTQAAADAGIVDAFLEGGRTEWTHVMIYRIWDNQPCCTNSLLNADLTRKPVFNVYHSRVLWSRGAGDYDTLAPGWVRRPGQAVHSADGRFQFTYQSDGNLVLSQQGTQLWASNTSGTSPGRTIMQTDGNLVIYDGSGTAVWSSGTGGNPTSYDTFLLVQDDGNVVIANISGQALWSTGTCCH